MSTFEYLAWHKSRLDKLINKHNKDAIPGFTKVFHQLFPKPGEKLSCHMKSWLDLIFAENNWNPSIDFEDRDDLMRKVQSIFKALLVPETTASQNQQHFWAFLIWVKFLFYKLIHIVSDFSRQTRRQPNTL